MKGSQDEIIERRAEPPVGIDESPPVRSQPQPRAGSASAVFEKCESRGIIQLPEQSPRVAVRHLHARRGAAQRAEPVHGFEKIGLTVAEQRSRAEGQPELRFDAEP